MKNSIPTKEPWGDIKSIAEVVQVVGHKHVSPQTALLDRDFRVVISVITRD